MAKKNMKAPKSITVDLFESISNVIDVKGNIDPAFVNHMDILSAFTTESFYILDIRKRQICYVSPYTQNLCGYPVKEILDAGFNFYSKVVHHTDQLLMKTIHKALLRYCKRNGEQRAEIDYFSCTFRLQWKYDRHAQPISFVIYHRVKPVWDKDGELRYFLCSAGDTVLKEGFLRLYYRNSMKYEAYNFTSGQWEQSEIKPLSDREKMILILARHGISRKEIAGLMCVGVKTLQNQMTTLFAKLGVKTILQAIVLVSNRRMLFGTKPAIIKPLPTAGASPRHPRHVLTPDELQHIQQALDRGQSIRHVARQADVAESAIRYLIAHGKLHK
jgi:DNA-binding NarL/FixJ family response regulator